MSELEDGLVEDCVAWFIFVYRAPFVMLYKSLYRMNSVYFCFVCKYIFCGGEFLYDMLIGRKLPDALVQNISRQLVIEIWRPADRRMSCHYTLV